MIVLIAVGQGTQKGVTDEIRGLGTDLIFVESSAAATTTQGGGLGAAGTSTLVQSDADTIAAGGIPGITAVAAVAAQATIDAQAIAGAENVGAEVVGTSSNYAEVRDLAVSSGGFITPLQDEDGDLVAVLGARVAETLYPGLDPVGQDVRLSFAGGRITIGFTVLGVLEEQGGSGEADDQVFVPLSGIGSRFRFLFTPTGDLRVTQIDIQTANGVDEERVKEEVSELLLFLHETTEPDFVIQSQDDLISAATEVSNTLSILLGSIAGISLLVGGIGVMNIMLVSVTERTREIGIRRAVGASAGDIVKQFVTEALTLSLFGGLVGIGIGISASLVIDGREIGGQEMTTLIQPWSIAAAFAVAAGVGFASGSYPAYRATALDPIAALRNAVSLQPLLHARKNMVESPSYRSCSTPSGLAQTDERAEPTALSSATEASQSANTWTHSAQAHPPHRYGFERDGERCRAPPAAFRVPVAQVALRGASAAVLGSWAAVARPREAPSAVPGPRGRVSRIAPVDLRTRARDTPSLPARSFLHQ